MKLQEKLLKIQSELKAPKNQFNKFGNYKYRNQEDVLEALKPLLKKNDVALILTDEIHQTDEGLHYVNAVAKLMSGEESIVVMAQAGIDLARKGMDLAQSFGSSSSYARKYALNGMFLIDDTKDADTQAPPVKKPMLRIDSEEFNKAKKYIKEGGDLSKIKNKYQISKKAEQSLIK